VEFECTAGGASKVIALERMIQPSGMGDGFAGSIHRSSTACRQNCSKAMPRQRSIGYLTGEPVRHAHDHRSALLDLANPASSTLSGKAGSSARGESRLRRQVSPR